MKNPYGNLSKCTVEAIENMEKTGLKHQEDSDQVADQISSDFCTWLRGLPKGETENINFTTADYIQQLFDEQVYQDYLRLSGKRDNSTHYLFVSKPILISTF